MQTFLNEIHSQQKGVIVEVKTYISYDETQDEIWQRIFAQIYLSYTRIVLGWNLFHRHP